MSRLAALSKHLNRPLIKQERGVALIMVLVLLAVLSSALIDFSFQTKTELESARNLRDGLQAEYLARSGVEIERLLVSVLSQGGADQLGIGPDQLAQLLEVSLNSGDLSGVFGGASSAFTTNGLGDLPGEMHLPPPEKENSKLNINAPSSNANGRQCLFNQLRDSLADERYQGLFEADARLVPDPAGEFAGSVLDWSDKDTTLFGASGPENDPYGLLQDAYAKKDTPFYTLDEMQLVWGVGDDMFYTLADSLTVYGTGNACSVDMVDGSDLRLRTTLCGCLATPQDAAVICGPSPAPIDTFLQSLGGLRAFFPMMGVKTWQGFVQLQETLDGLGEVLGALGGAAGTPALPEIPWAQSCPNITFGARATIYTIKGEGQVGDVRSRIRAVLDLNQDKQQGGRLVYWRVE